MLYFKKVNCSANASNVFDADFEGLASNVELYIFNQEDSQNRWGLFWHVLYMQWDMSCKVITAKVPLVVAREVNYL